MPSFDDFLGALASRKRKAIRKERAAALRGLEIVALRGAEIGPANGTRCGHFYQDTGSRKWGQPYLTREFFDLVGERMGDQLLMFLAYRGRRPIAGALNFIGAGHALRPLLGLRSRKCRSSISSSAITGRSNGRSSMGSPAVQAGAQGEHKLARGYEPVITRSAHFIPNPGFREAVADFLDGEREAIASEVEWLRRGLPYRSVLVGIDRDRAAAGVGHAAVHAGRREAPRRFARSARPRSARPCRRATGCRRAPHRAPACSGSPPMPHPLGQLVRGDGADEIFARAGRGDRGRRGRRHRCRRRSAANRRPGPSAWRSARRSRSRRRHGRR